MRRTEVNTPSWLQPEAKKQGSQGPLAIRRSQLTTGRWNCTSQHSQPPGQREGWGGWMCPISSINREPTSGSVVDHYHQSILFDAAHQITTLLPVISTDVIDISARAFIFPAFLLPFLTGSFTRLWSATRALPDRECRPCIPQSLVYKTHVMVRALTFWRFWDWSY
jgi:hypothetical protein